ncbi:MAG: Ig-like domain-containing protein, partial [Thermoplasmata archaeon]
MEEETVGLRRIRFKPQIVLVAVLLSSAILIIPPLARADTWMETTNADFANGMFAGTEVVGVGPDASVQIVRTHDDWVNMTPERMPAPRDGYGLAYDKKNQVMTLFGGYVSGEGNTNETWEYDFAGNNWTKIETNGSPPARSSPGMAYDMLDEVTVLFGGYGNAGFLDDTWEYYAVNHTWMEIHTTPHPSAMVSSPMVFDTAGQRIMMVGEEIGTSDFQTWRYDAFQHKWTELHPTEEPPSRSGHALAFDMKGGRLVLFGGAIGMDLQGDTWEYDSFGNVWVKTMDTGPTPRVSAAMEYLPFWEGVILFGGFTSNGFENETWLYTSFGAPKWESLFTTVAPEGRLFMEMEYDYRCDMILMFSGEKNSTRFNDTWTFGPTYPPEGKYASSMYDSGFAETDWSAIWWNQTMAQRPKHTEILVQLAASNYSTGPFNFGGPDGSFDTYYTLGEGETIWKGLHGRFFKYGVTLRTYHGLETPALQNITIAFNYVPAPPRILKTEPYHAEVDVNVVVAVKVYFSERMDTSTVQVSIQPNIVFWRAWSEGDSILTLNHNEPFQESTTYTIEISGKDIDGNNLVPGPVPNPWTFNVQNLYPYIRYYAPDHQQEDVPLTTPIEIKFSESMNTSTLIWNMTPDPGGWSESWGENDSKVTLWHANLLELCTWYQVEVRYAEDLSGNQLVPHHVANPWNFGTFCDAPYITYTSPGHLWPDVTVNSSIHIGFSEAMDHTSLQWTIDPDPGGWTVVWTMPIEVVLHHANDFVECMSHTVEVTQAKDLSGKDLEPWEIPNPWTFMTICDGPYIMDTFPADGTEDWAVNATIYIAFSEIMDTETVTWEINPDPGIWDTRWEFFVFVLTPLQVLDECTNHTFEVTYARDRSGNVIVPGPVPNPFTFKTICIHPVILWTEPADGATSVALDASILVKWNEPMNVSAFTWQADPDIDLTANWNPAEDLVTLTHIENFIGGTVYTVHVDGYDKEGYQWRPGPAPNPWRFTTVPADNPYILYKDPDIGDQWVPFYKSITIEFSKPMNQSTVTWSIAPDLSLSATWSNNSTLLVLSHANPFLECAIIDFEVDGYDWQGLRLAPPKVWWFAPVCFRPYIVSTLPVHPQIEVPLNETIVVEFSEPINETRLEWSIAPDPRGWTIGWNWNGSIAYFNHSVNFTECLEYEVEMIRFFDMEGRPMKPGLVPNPWRFMTQCESPYIVTTDPYHLQEYVPYDHPITVVFSEPMAIYTVSWSLNPNYPPPDTILFTVQWFDNDTRAVFTHDKDFHICETYSFWISSGTDVDFNFLVPGPVPNPFNFTTICTFPLIAWTDPYSDEENAEVTRSVRIGFSEALNQSSLNWTIDPDPGGWSETWILTSVTLSHATDFDYCQLYHVTVHDFKSYFEVPGENLPLSWYFTTECPNPQIISTEPEDGAGDVALNAALVVQFDKTMNTTSLNWTINPDPGGWSESWEENDTRLVLSHSNPFTMDTSYLVYIIEALDTFGLPLKPGPVPNPWQFTTGRNVSAPRNLQVWRFFPDDVQVVWNPVTGATSYFVYSTTDKFEPWPWADVTEVIAPTTLAFFSGHLSDGLDHYYVVRAYSLALGQESGNSTMGVKIDKAFVTNPLKASIYWMSLPYRSVYSKASDITNELTEGKVNVIAKWDRDRQEIISYYYARGRWRGRDFALSAGDGFYVSAVSDFSWYINGTDISVSLNFSF